MELVELVYVGLCVVGVVLFAMLVLSGSLIVEAFLGENKADEIVENWRRNR